MLATIIGKFSSLIQKQTMQIQLSGTTGTSNGTAFYGQMKLKGDFWLQTHQMSLVQTGIKQYAMSTVKYTAESLILWACFFSARGPEHLVRMHSFMDSTDKKSKPDCLC